MTIAIHLSSNFSLLTATDRMFTHSGIPTSFDKVPFAIGRLHYLGICFLFALAVRAVSLAFIAATKVSDDIRCEKCGAERVECPECHRKKRKWRWSEYFREYRYCWSGLSTGHHYDLWLPFFVGFAELTAYPILMVYGQFQAIGWWIAIRTAGSWVGWKSQRTVFYRFLLGMILNLAIAYVFLTKYIAIA